MANILKGRSRKFYFLLAGGVLAAMCLCVATIQAMIEGPQPDPTATVTSSATATMVPTETETPFPTWTPRPTATKKPTEIPTEAERLATIAIPTDTPFIFKTQAPAAGNCNCAIDYNCADFSRRSEAQACFVSCGGNNWSGLDADGDGVVCEGLP